MDLVAIIKDFGFPIAVAIALGWWLKSSLTDRILALESRLTASDGKVDNLNIYIRDDLAKIANESHQRERVLVDLLRQDFQPHPAPPSPPPPAPPQPPAKAVQDPRTSSTEIVLASIYQHQEHA